MQMYDKHRIYNAADAEEVAVNVGTEEEFRDPHDIINRLRDVNNQIYDLTKYKEKLTGLYKEKMMGYEEHFREMLNKDPANKDLEL